VGNRGFTARVEARYREAPVRHETVLITGGAGFIGSAVVRRLIRNTNATVLNVDKLTYAGNLESLAEVADRPRHRFVRCDIGDRMRIRKLLADHRPSAVIHLAAESHVDRSIEGPAPFLNTNVVGTFVLLDETLRYWKGVSGGRKEEFRFLHVSTDEVFGSLPDSGLFNEESPYRPRSPYSASKAGADHLAKAWFHTYGLPVIVTSSSNNYGPYQYPEKFIPLMILNALEGKPLPVYGEGENVRDWLFVEDQVDALLAVLEHGRAGETYNIGGGNELRNIDVVRRICALIDDNSPSVEIGPREELIRFVADRPGHDYRYAMDITKIRSEIGWSPRESFETGLSKTVRWYESNATWCEHVQAGTYDRERLGLRRCR
jgi:dTDP-glucose 4,6-dehydratase